MRLPSGKRMLLLEAAFGLIAARLALRFLPFRRLKPFLVRRVKGKEAIGDVRARFREEVVWAVGAAAKHLPGEFVCFPRAIAAQAMLRRRRAGTALYYGVSALPGHGRTAHVWVQDGDSCVVGNRQESLYTVIARYPED